MKKLSYFLTIGALVLSSSSGLHARTTNNAKRHEHKQPQQRDSAQPSYFTLEGMPPDTEQDVVKDRQDIARAIKRNPNLRYFMNSVNLWNPGHTITVAFNGGSPELQADVAEIAQEWSEYGNVRFDFGYNNETGTYRTWSPSDRNYSADVRVSFEGRLYVSKYGTNSRYGTPPGSPSLWLGSPDRSNSRVWRGHILHEFGHALGFYHEHVNPTETCDFRWEDDPNYVPTKDKYDQFIPDANGNNPGVYTVFGGPPNNWSRSWTENNLKANFNDDPSGYILSASDRESIMHYAFPPFLLDDGDASSCYVGFNSELSQGDKEGIARAYPRFRGAASTDNAARKKNLEKLIEAPEISARVKEKYQLQLKSIQ